MTNPIVLDARTNHDAGPSTRPQPAAGAKLQEELAANTIPGAERLGYGMNILGGYSFDATLKPLFKLGAVNREYVDPRTGRAWGVPSNVSDPSGSFSTADAHTFENSRQFTEHLQASASVSGSVGAFNGAFEAAYSRNQQDSSTYSYALLEAHFCSWNVDLSDFSLFTLRDDVKNDPDFAGLPHELTPENRDKFFAFFRKFGTHFIHRVFAGGLLHYYVAVSRSSKLDEQQIRTSVKAEYQGLIASTKGEADAHWSSTAQSWTDSRQASSFTVPALGGIVDWVDPSKGTYDSNGHFRDWRKDVEQNPQSMSFRLEPISRIFSGAQESAVEEAFAAYADSRARVEADTFGMGAIFVNGKPIIPAEGFPTGQLAVWHLVVLDRATLRVVSNKLYAVSARNSDELADARRVYYTMMQDVRPFAGDSSKILLASASNIVNLLMPNGEFYQFLRSFGAGDALDRWMQTDGAHPKNDAYVLVGAGGAAPGTGLDRLAEQPEGPRASVDAFFQHAGNQYSPVPY